MHKFYSLTSYQSVLCVTVRFQRQPSFLQTVQKANAVRHIVVLSPAAAKPVVPKSPGLVKKILAYMQKIVRAMIQSMDGEIDGVQLKRTEVEACRQ